MIPLDPSKVRVLVVDDQKNMRATTAMLLRSAGYSAREAAGAEEIVYRADYSPQELLDLGLSPQFVAFVFLDPKPAGFRYRCESRNFVLLQGQRDRQERQRERAGENGLGARAKNAVNGYA